MFGKKGKLFKFMAKYEYMLEIRMNDMKKYQRIKQFILKRVKNIANGFSMLVISQIRHLPGLPDKLCH